MLLKLCTSQCIYSDVHAPAANYWLNVGGTYECTMNFKQNGLSVLEGLQKMRRILACKERFIISNRFCVEHVLQVKKKTLTLQLR
jgi:hypothetical protein